MDGASVAGDAYADYKQYGRNSGIGTPAHYSSSYSDFIAAFYELLHKWSSETSFESNLDIITEHPSYRTMVSMGSRALPLILDELRTQPSLLVYALEDITGERPYATNINGDIRSMSDHWVLWADREEWAA